MTQDPEARRIEELLAKQRAGEASAAESEELALYAREHPALAGRIEQMDRERELGGGWLARVEADSKLQAAETSPRVRLERGLGLGLMVGGFAFTMLAPVVGLAAVGTGVLLLLYSFVRARLATHRSDPYKDVAK